MALQFDRITPSDAQVDTLFKLLKQRAHKISHTEAPSLDFHRAFVRSHPYRAWYLVGDEDGPFGSVYLTEMNEIGINLVRSVSVETVGELLDFMRRAHTPLPAIPSVRGEGFFVHVAISNSELQAALKGLGHQAIQTTYRVTAPKG